MVSSLLSHLPTSSLQLYITILFLVHVFAQGVASGDINTAKMTFSFLGGNSHLVTARHQNFGGNSYFVILIKLFQPGNSLLHIFSLVETYIT